MIFLNGLLAFGALALSIPLAIHLLHRSRFKTVEWGAMHLLEPVVRINRRRIQWTQILLLLIRCALPVLLAFCLARPVLTGLQALPGDAPQSLVLVIDDSLSMSAIDGSSRSRIQRVREQLGEQLSHMSRRDEVLWMPTSQADSVPSTMAAGDAIERLRNLSAASGPFDLAKVLRSAINASANASNSDRRILLVSDFQSGNLSDSAMESLQRLAEDNDQQNLLRPTIQFWNVGGDSASLGNLSVDSIEALSPAVVPDRETRFVAKLRNASDTSINDVSVRWSIDGKELEPKSVSLPARSTALTHLSHSLSKPGIHEIAVFVDYPDSLIEDNHRSIAVEVIREVDVLLVDGQPSKSPLQGETDFLAIALSPFAFAYQDQVDAVRASVVKVGAMSDKLKAALPNIIVLANVASLTSEQQNEIAEFVYGGGSLVLFDGGNLDQANYTNGFQFGDENLTLPAKMGAVVGDPVSSRERPLRIAQPSPSYAPWQRLSVGQQQPFSDVELYAYRKLSLLNDESISATNRNQDRNFTAEATTVLLSAVGGDPLVVTARRGRGRIVQFAFAANDSWTSLPLRRIFLPMMQQLVLDLVGSGKAITVNTGTPMTVFTSEFAPAGKDLSSDDRAEQASACYYTVQPPGSGELTIEPESRERPSLPAASSLTWNQTNRAGLYRFRQICREHGDAAPTVTKTFRVAEVPAEESVLRDMQPERLSKAAEFVAATVYERADSIGSAEQVRRFGRETWRFLLYLLLIAMILEIFVQQRFVLRPSGSGA